MTNEMIKALALPQASFLIEALVDYSSRVSLPAFGDLIEVKAFEGGD